MQLTSSAFSHQAAVPRRFTCDGEDVSPDLEWTGAPPDVKSFVVLCDDPDAPAGTWHHWAAYDIPPDRGSLAAAQASHVSEFKQAINDFGRPGYGGPCPPRGHGKHRYHFRLLALSVPHLVLRAQPKCRDVEDAARKHVIAEATLVGVYER